MRTLGEMLRQARLDRGTSLSDAARDTRIRRGYLEALEAEDPAGLPPPVYTRGFVRTYAEYLGLDGQAMADLYQPPARIGQSPPLRPAAPRPGIPRDVPVRQLLYVLGGVAALALLAFLWNQYQQAAAAIREPDSQVVRTGTLAATRQPTPFRIAMASPSPSATPTPEPAPSPTASPAPSATPPPDGILVQFRTSSRVYVEASVDGRQVLAETLPAGTERQLPLGKDAVMMRVSSGSAVEITLNGKRQEASASKEPVEFTWRR